MGLKDHMTSEILEAGLNKFADNDVLAIVYSKDKPKAMVTFSEKLGTLKNKEKYTGII